MLGTIEIHEIYKIKIIKKEKKKLKRILNFTWLNLDSLGPKNRCFFSCFIHIPLIANIKKIKSQE